jgi:hypothetical protein
MSMSDRPAVLPSGQTAQRHRDPGPAATILTPDALRLRQAPIADCARYDSLRLARAAA